MDKGDVCVCVYTERKKEREEYYSAIKKNKIFPFAKT